MTFDSIFSLWPILPLGADDDKDRSNSGGDGSGANGQQSNNQGGQGNSNSSGGKNDGDDADDPYRGLSAKELKRLLADAETNGTTAQQELDKLQAEKTEEERKKNDDVTNLKGDVAERDSTISELRASLAKASIINAINENKQYEWNSANVVAQQLDSEKVKVDDRGRVTGLEKELVRISGDENLKFLLRTKNSDEKDGSDKNNGNGNGNNGNQQSNGVTGFQPGQGGASSSGQIGGIDAAQAAELVKKMPALATRM